MHSSSEFLKILTQLPMLFYILDTNWKFLLSEGKGLENLGLKPGEV